MEEIPIKELDLHMIYPTLDEIQNPSYGSFKLTVIGRSGSGKSRIISSILRNKAQLIGSGMVLSLTENENKFFSNILPNLYIYDEYEERYIERFIERQKLAVTQEHLKDNPWSLLILDDVIDDPSLLRTNLYKQIYKFGRHWKFLFILSLQYCLDISPTIRTNTEGIFIMRDPIRVNRKKIWENYASIIPTFELFCAIMDQITDDYTALYIHNKSTSNDYKDCVYWYKADISKEPITFGSHIFRMSHEIRYDENYKK